MYFCDSPWLCPSCAPKRAAERTERLERVFDAAEAKAWSIVFVTLTAAHTRGDRLADLKTLVSGASRRARQGRAWEKLAAGHGIQGVIIGPEVTHGAHGWHYHQHAAVIVSTCDPALAEKAGNAVLGRYLAAIAEAGGRAVPQAQDVQVVWRRQDLQGYLAKGSAAWEVGAAGTGKRGRKGARTPWDLVADADAGDRHAAALFAEYASAMPGTRSCVITKAIADRLGIAPEADAEAPGEVEAEPDMEHLGDVPRAQWHRLLRHGHVPVLFSAIAAGADWSTVSAEIQRLDPGELIPRRTGPVPLSVSALELAREARCVRAQAPVSRTLDDAIGMIVERHQRDAQRLHRPLVLPHLPTVARLLAEGFA